MRRWGSGTSSLPTIDPPSDPGGGRGRNPPTHLFGKPTHSQSPPPRGQDRLTQPLTQPNATNDRPKNPQSFTGPQPSAWWALLAVVGNCRQLLQIIRNCQILFEIVRKYLHPPPGGQKVAVAYCHRNCRSRCLVREYGVGASMSGTVSGGSRCSMESKASRGATEPAGSLQRDAEGQQLSSWGRKEGRQKGEADTMEWGLEAWVRTPPPGKECELP